MEENELIVSDDQLIAAMERNADNYHRSDDWKRECEIAAHEAQQPPADADEE